MEGPRAGATRLPERGHTWEQLAGTCPRRPVVGGRNSWESSYGPSPSPAGQDRGRTVQRGGLLSRDLTGLKIPEVNSTPSSSLSQGLRLEDLLVPALSTYQEPQLWPAQEKAAPTDTPHYTLPDSSLWGDPCGLPGSSEVWAQAFCFRSPECLAHACALDGWSSHSGAGPWTLLARAGKGRPL